MSRRQSIVRSGLNAAWRLSWFVAVAWAILFGISLVSVWPAWQWWSAALGSSLEGDRLLYGLDLSVVKELTQYDRTGTLRLVGHSAIAGAVVAAFLNPLFAGGFLGVLTATERGPDARGFFASGVRHYGPFLRALVYTVVVALVVLSIVLAASTAVVKAVAETDAEIATMGLATGSAALALLVVALFVAVLDVARARLMLDDSRRALAAVVYALLFVPRHLVSFAGLGLAYLVLALALSVVVFGLQAALPNRPINGCWLCAGSWTTIAIGALLSQVFAFGRLWLRTATLASTLAVVEARSRVLAPAPAVVESPPVQGEMRLAEPDSIERL